MGIGSKYQSSKLKNVFAPPTPPPLPPKPNFLVYAKPATKPSTVPSVTNEEIAKYWRQKRMDEEDHLLAAIKAAARIRAHNLSVSSKTLNFKIYHKTDVLKIILMNCHFIL